MIPIYDEPRDPDHDPVVTLVLIAVNVLVALATLPLLGVPWVIPASDPIFQVLDTFDDATRHDWLVLTWGFRPTSPALVTTFTSMFLHAGPLHLLGNMLFLWSYGPNVERRLGHGPFLLLYLTSGLLGTMLYALVKLGSPMPMIGASGAISGILGAYLVFFPHNRIVMWLLATFRLPAWFLLSLYLVVENIVPFLLPGSAVVAHSAHLGGFFGGAVLALGLAVVQPARRRRRQRDAPAAATTASPFARTDALLEQGMLLDAHRELLALTTSPECGPEARARLEALEQDPTFQRAARYAPPPHDGANP